MTTKPIRSGRAAQRALAYTLQRDKGICWICGHPGADSRDHIKPVTDFPDLANDPNNWAAAHGSARPEYDCPGQYARGNYAGPRRPTRQGNITIVVGPPAAGKTTHIAQHRQPGDLVVDHDALAQALGSPHQHTSNGVHASIAKIARDAVIAAIIERNLTAWIIHTAPTPTQISNYQRAHATPLLIDPGKGTCIHRARTQRQGWTIAAIKAWYDNDAERLREWTTTTEAAAPRPAGHRQW